MRIVESCLMQLHRIAPTERGMYRVVRIGRRFMATDQGPREFHVPWGYHMTLDLNTYPDCTMAFGLYELSTARLIKRRLRPGDHFVDGGANIGYFTLLAARRGAYVHAFEPMPANRERLIEHLKRNQLADRVTVYPLALTDRPGPLRIHEPGQDEQGNHGAASLFGDGQAVDIEGGRLDDALEAGDAAKVRLIKLDIEGAEPLAIAGMTQLLGRDNPPALVGELNATTASAANMPVEAWVSRALNCQPAYRVYDVGWRLKKINSHIDNLGTIGQTNLLLQAR